MSYKKGDPTPPPRGTVTLSNFAMFIAVVALCFSIYALKSVYKDYAYKFKATGFSKDCAEPMGSNLLSPGWHLLDKLPFIVVVPPGYVGIVYETMWAYNVKHVGTVVIPQGYVGVVEGCKGIQKETLQPGKYPINLDEYKVSLFDIRKKRYRYED